MAKLCCYIAVLLPHSRLIHRCYCYVSTGRFWKVIVVGKQSEYDDSFTREKRCAPLIADKRCAPLIADKFLFNKLKTMDHNTEKNVTKLGISFSVTKSMFSLSELHHMNDTTWITFCLYLCTIYINDSMRLQNDNREHPLTIMCSCAYRSSSQSAVRNWWWI